MAKTVIIVCGPTAVGKTAFAIQLAQALHTSIVSCDSRQCYRELNIGVAKPSADELSAVKHYFTNSHSVHDNVNAVVFEHYALQAVSAIFEAQDAAVMVGGTGLYINAFCYGLDDIPTVDPAIRAHITNMYEKQGIAALQEQLKTDDPKYWQQAEQQNPQRLMRALEVLRSTGRSILEFRQGERKTRPFNIVLTGLELPREILYDRINRRVDQMMTDGLEREARELLPLKHLSALQTVGYRELFDHFDEKVTLEQAVTNIQTNTRHYAKRQMTWFKKNPDIHWFDAAAVTFDDVLQLL